MSDLVPSPSHSPAERPSARELAQQLDARLHAAMAPLTSGLSPVALALAFTDWWLHLATQPAQASRLAVQATQQALTLAGQSLSAAADTDPSPRTDARYADPAWRRWPWAPLVQLGHAAEDWWSDATALRGMRPHHQDMTRFFARQWLDMVSPANWGLANPQVLQRTLERRGGNLHDGLRHAVEDWRQRHGLPPLTPPAHPYRPGQDLAQTPGRVVYRNALIELIQYQPSTPTVQAEPVFIVPSWIMKYYILDLSPENSMVRWLVAQGHTVFILSWRNPDENDALLDMDDYLALGVFDPLAAIARLLPGEAVHACGYCLGGTLLAIAAAALSRPGAVARAAELPALQSVSLLAAITDFSEPGEMGVLIDDAQVSMLEDMMAERGFLTGAQMAGSFAYLHSRELVWSRRLGELWLGEAQQPNDLMAWNADTTRMPAAMHSQYLRRCYLRNELAQGRYPVENRPVSLSDIQVPMFVVGTETDHVSPWPAVFKIHHLCDTAITFVLTNGGHNAGIVSPPGHPRRRHALLTRPAHGPWLDPHAWQAQAPVQAGSWWTRWSDWLLHHGSGRQVAAREPLHDDALGAAPGQYVHTRYPEG